MPQNRERVFIVGHSRRFPRREVFPIKGENGKNLRKIVGGSQGNTLYDASGISATIAAQTGGLGGSGGGIYAVLTPDRVEKRQNGRRFKEPGEPMFTLTAQDRHGVLIKHKPEVRAVALQNANMQGRRIKEEGEPSFTISATDRHGVMVSRKLYNDIRIRRLTPLECFRLQGFPDSHYHNAIKAGVSNSQLYKQAGNAVTVNVVYEIARRFQND